MIGQHIMALAHVGDELGLVAYCEKFLIFEHTES